eukprot:TRINITY_DN26487_c0_g1_i1.p1 TRINITY_DN26487_c0_g1~~TRINITY_DN26487_c0_g1_i1.p1  ORF type:complete len:523 (+),score=168.06 TRINITY_DN26487_c0_g1_i1:54-1571(+)
MPMTPRNLAPIGAAWLQQHGHGKIVNVEQRDALKKALTTELATQGFPPSAVEAEVTRFLQHGRASESNFDRLARRVQKTAKGRRNGELGALETPRHVEPGAEIPSRTAVHQGPFSARAGARLEPLVSKEPLALDVMTERSSRGQAEVQDIARWSKIATIQKYHMEEEKKQEHVAEKQKKMKYRDFLHSQMQERAAEKEQQLLDKMSIRAQVDWDHEKNMEEEDRLASRRQDQMLRLKDDIMSQVSAFYSRQEEQKIADKLQAQKEDERALQLLEEEHRIIQQKKDMQKASDAKQAEEWKEERLRMQEEKRKEAVDKLKERRRVEEQERVAASKDLSVNLKAKEESRRMLTELRAQKEAAEAEAIKRREERITSEREALAQMKAEEERFDEEERQKAEKHRKLTRDNVDFLHKQMKEKKTRRAQEMELDRKKNQESQEYTDHQIQVDKQMQEEKKKRKNKYKNELIEQIEIRKTKAVEGSKLKEDLLSEMEVSINKDMLETLVHYA